MAAGYKGTCSCMHRKHSFRRHPQRLQECRKEGSVKKELMGGLGVS